MMSAQDYFLSFPRFGKNAGLSRIRALMEALGNPQEQLRFVHVAGTNGKGSITSMLASIAQAGGLKTGCYTSPYITCFRERMQINGRPIPEEELDGLAHLLLPITDGLAAQGMDLCHFEVVTAAAFCWFAKEKCDLVCLETGLGGRLDATNSLSPESCVLSVLAAIGFDHMELLGNTIREIAYEKCGILKPGVPAVCYPDQPEDALEVIFASGAQKGCVLNLPSLSSLRDESSSAFSPFFSYGGQYYRLGLLGEHQLKNAVTAIEAAHVLKERGFSTITASAIGQGLASAFLPARLEPIYCWPQGPQLLLDGAHNAHGCRALSAFLQRVKGERSGPVILVMGMLADKNITEALSALLPQAEKAIAVPVENPRCFDPNRLAEKMSGFCPSTVCGSLSSGLSQARKMAGSSGFVVVCGSLYLAAQARALLVSDKKEERNFT